MLSLKKEDWKWFMTSFPALFFLFFPILFPFVLFNLSLCSLSFQMFPHLRLESLIKSYNHNTGTVNRVRFLYNCRALVNEIIQGPCYLKFYHPKKCSSWKCRLDLSIRCFYYDHTIIAAWLILSKLLSHQSRLVS